METEVKSERIFVLLCYLWEGRWAIRPQRKFAREVRAAGNAFWFYSSSPPLTITSGSGIWVGLALTANKPHGGSFIDLLNNIVVMGTLASIRKELYIEAKLQNLLICRHHLIMGPLSPTTHVTRGKLLTFYMLRFLHLQNGGLSHLVIRFWEGSK